MTDARERFKVGDRVRYSEKGREAFRSRKVDRRATVVGFGKSRALRTECIYVVSDGTKSRQAYHHSYWEKDSEPPRA